MTSRQFQKIHGERPDHVRSNRHGLVWALPARKIGAGWEPSYDLRGYRARVWTYTIQGLHDWITTGDTREARRRTKAGVVHYLMPFPNRRSLCGLRNVGLRKTRGSHVWGCVTCRRCLAR